MGTVVLRSGDHKLKLAQATPDESDSRSTLYLRILVSGAGSTDDIAEREVRFVLNDYKQGTYKNVEILSTVEQIDEIGETS